MVWVTKKKNRSQRTMTIIETKPVFGGGGKRHGAHNYYKYTVRKDVKTFWNSLTNRRSKFYLGDTVRASRVCLLGKKKPVRVQNVF